MLANHREGQASATPYYSLCQVGDPFRLVADLFRLSGDLLKRTGDLMEAVAGEGMIPWPTVFGQAGMTKISGSSIRGK